MFRAIENMCWKIFKASVIYSLINGKNHSDDRFYTILKKKKKQKKNPTYIA